MSRVADPLDRTRFPADPWVFQEQLLKEGGQASGADPADPVGATLFAVANGCLGLRGDGDPDRSRAAFVNGFHETWRIRHPEYAYGLASVGQTIQALPDAADFQITVAGTALAEPDWTREKDERRLDFRAGETVRTTVWRRADGVRVEVVATRLVCLSRAAVAVATCAVRPLGSQLAVAVAPKLTPAGCAAAAAEGNLSEGNLPEDSLLGGNLSTANPFGAGFLGDKPDPRRGDLAADGGLEELPLSQTGPARVQAYVCRNSGLGLVLGRQTELTLDGGPLPLSPVPVSPGPVSPGPALAAGSPIPSLAAGAPVAPLAVGSHLVPAGSVLQAVSYLAYLASPRPPAGVTAAGLRVAVPPADLADLADRCRADLAAAARAALAGLRAEQARWLAAFWERSDVIVELADPATDGQAGLQQAIRWSLFQLAQASACLDKQGVAAKGVTGSGYSGHYFWDADIYVFPFLLYTDPARARQLLDFRHAMLPAARRRARELDLAGALFPWRTVNGEEASAYFPAGTAQFHIDADIAYAAAQYAAVAGNAAYAAGDGFDLVVETARMWASLGFDGPDGRFHLHGVTGPDEYSALVDDNFYTNVMARFNLLTAARWAEALTAGAPTEADAATGTAAAAALARLKVTAAEAAGWRRAGQAMAVTWDADRGVHPQDKAFLDRQPWDLAAVPPDRRPLLLHYHPLSIYRRQIIKQADVVLALLLRGADFSAAEKQADFTYYDPLTTGDSTLSAVSQAVIAAEVGASEQALRHFSEALAVDLADRHHNTRDGVHIASAAGLWGVLVQGFGGLRDFGETPSLSPRLPAGWRRLSFVLTVQGSRLRIEVTPDSVTQTLLAGPPLTLPVLAP
ncbi:MAG: glycoside hydrolase family 65 protein [Propionibacteriaceae bacterium]|jgi:alpha,alpha-trehalose phosphorylase|nr:glycoside hydrolase family 65 protein [Propionibacteriaceae bacterium]